MATESSTTASGAALREAGAPVLTYSHCFATCSSHGLYESRSVGYSRSRRFNFSWRFLFLRRSLEASASLAGSSLLQPANEAQLNGPENFLGPRFRSRDRENS